MMAPGEWDRWEATWRDAKTTPAELEQFIDRTRRARRALVVVRLLSLGVAVIALVAVGLALRHAASRGEAILGLIVGLSIAAAWLVDDRGQQLARDNADAAPIQYAELRRDLCVRRLRFARLGWIVAALDVAFLGPWWVGGIAVHGIGLLPSQLVSLWGPLAAMIGFVVWTFGVRARSLAELRRLAPAATPDADPATNGSQ